MSKLAHIAAILVGVAIALLLVGGLLKHTSRRVSTVITEGIEEAHWRGACMQVCHPHKPDFSKTGECWCLDGDMATKTPTVFEKSK